MDLIDSKGFHVSSFIDDVNFIPDFKDLMTLITSDCQNGKTFLVIAVSLIYISLGFTPVFIVLSKSQVLQLTFRLKAYIRELKTYLVSLNMFSEEELDFLSENFLYFDAENKLSDDDNRLSLAINSEKPRFVICIKHYQHLERVNKEITDDSKICLIADEAQVSCCYKDISNIPTYHDDSVKYDKEFITLRKNSTKFIAVSATVQDIIMVEENLYSKLPSMESPLTFPSLTIFQTSSLSTLKPTIQVPTGTCSLVYPSEYALSCSLLTIQDSTK
jgi:hypothetical protein